MSRISPQGYIFGLAPVNTNPFWDEQGEGYETTNLETQTEVTLNNSYFTANITLTVDGESTTIPVTCPVIGVVDGTQYILPFINDGKVGLLYCEGTDENVLKLVSVMTKDGVDTAEVTDIVITEIEGGGSSATVYDGTLTISVNGVSVGTFSANQETDAEINITVPTDYITDEELATAINNALADYDTSAEVTAKIALAVENFVTATQLATALADYDTSAEVDTKINSALADYDTSTEVDTKISNAFTNYDTSTEVSTKISNALTNYDTSTEVDTKINSACDELDETLRGLIDNKLDTPSSDGTDGQVLKTDGAGGTYWGDTSGDTVYTLSANVDSEITELVNNYGFDSTLTFANYEQNIHTLYTIAKLAFPEGNEDFFKMGGINGEDLWRTFGNFKINSLFLKSGIRDSASMLTGRFYTTAGRSGMTPFFKRKVWNAEEQGFIEEEIIQVSSRTMLPQEWDMSLSNPYDDTDGNDSYDYGYNMWAGKMSTDTFRITNADAEDGGVTSGTITMSGLISNMTLPVIFGITGDYASVTNHDIITNGFITDEYVCMLFTGDFEIEITLPIGYNTEEETWLEGNGYVAIRPVNGSVKAHCYDNFNDSIVNNTLLEYELICPAGAWLRQRIPCLGLGTLSTDATYTRGEWIF